MEINCKSCGALINHTKQKCEYCGCFYVQKASVNPLIPNIKLNTKLAIIGISPVWVVVLGLIFPIMCLKK